MMEVGGLGSGSDVARTALIEVESLKVNFSKCDAAGVLAS